MAQSRVKTNRYLSTCYLQSDCAQTRKMGFDVEDMRNVRTSEAWKQRVFHEDKAMVTGKRYNVFFFDYM